MVRQVRDHGWLRDHARRRRNGIHPSPNQGSADSQASRRRLADLSRREVVQVLAMSTTTEGILFVGVLVGLFVVAFVLFGNGRTWGKYRR